MNQTPKPYPWRWDRFVRRWARVVEYGRGGTGTGLNSGVLPWRPLMVIGMIRTQETRDGHYQISPSILWGTGIARSMVRRGRGQSEDLPEEQKGNEGEKKGEEQGGVLRRVAQSRGLIWECQQPVGLLWPWNMCPPRSTFNTTLLR